MKKLLLIPFSLLLSPFLCEAQIITTIAGTGTGGYNGDNIQATAAEVNTPSDMSTDKAGNVYICDFLNNRIRRVDAITGIITTYAGTGTAGYNGDNIAATAAEIFEPTGIAVDTSGNVFIADYQNHRARRVDHLTQIMTTVAGTGTGAYNGDNIAATSAELQDPEGVSTDDSGNVYIADTYNYRIRKIITKTGIITTVAGNGVLGYSGDGGSAVLAEINHVEKVKAGPNGDVYIPEEVNYRIRYVDYNTGIITTIGGNGMYGFSGNGGQATAAEIAGPEGITLDALGNVYFADISNNWVQKIDISSGVITRVAGLHVGGYSGDGGPALMAELRAPVGLHIDNMGNMYIADNGNQRYRKVSSITTGIPSVSNLDEVAVYPVPNSGSMTVQLPGSGYKLLKVYDAIGREVYAQLLDASKPDITLNINLGNVSNGIYIMQIITNTGTLGKRIVIAK
ncbi:MAG TPA: T9SS type A sorting domain-containing protein [Bacteroidia bacterium]|nr:T9SS type A sorting domain-containing protein [Bacteroidia bacterium]